jgi:hypothetical protein
MTDFEKEFPMFIDMVCNYNQNMILFGVIDDINHLKKCQEFYEKHKEAMPKREGEDFWSWMIEINRCDVSLSRSWHPERRGIPISPMFVKNVLLKNV